MNYMVGLVVVALIVQAKSADLPSHFKSCDRHSVKFLECLSDAVTKAVVSLGPSGLKSFKILPIEPLEAGELFIGDNGGAVSIKQSYKNVKLHGLTKGLRVDYDSVDFDNLVFRSTCYNDQVDFVGDYAIEGQVLILPIKGNGKSNITMLGLKSKNNIYCEKYKKNGETYLRVKKYEIKFSPKKVLLSFSNLFNGDPVLSEQMSKFLNDNAEIVFKETQGEYEETFGLVFAKITNDIFSRVPMNKIFPE